MAVKSNGLGKGFCAAVVLLWFMHRHQDSAIVLSTAPTFPQVRHILWRQVHRLYRPNAELLGGKMLGTRWEIADDRYAMGLSAENADQFQGFHSPNMFIVVDKAEGVSDEIYEAIEAVMTAALIPCCFSSATPPLCQGHSAGPSLKSATFITT